MDKLNIVYGMLGISIVANIGLVWKVNKLQKLLSHLFLKYVKE